MGLGTFNVVFVSVQDQGLHFLEEKKVFLPLFGKTQINKLLGEIAHFFSF